MNFPEFEADYEEIYGELNEMILELPEDPMINGGPAKINSDISKLSQYIDRVEVLQTEVSKKLSNLKSTIKNRKSLVKIFSNKKYSERRCDLNIDIVDTELEILKLDEIFDPLQNLVNVIDNKASYLKNKESRIRLQWRVMEKRIAMGEKPRPASFDDPTISQMERSETEDHKNTEKNLDDFLKTI